jgi:DNA-binding CsgD family transcriptional regulator/tetratricopeptide (TPR) repeat protein
VEGSGGFVGRWGELGRFQRVLAGDARLLLVVGDAGVGKTRFVGEALRAAAAGGVIAAWGGCLPLAEKLPLLPVAQALGELSRREGGLPLAEALDVSPPYVRTEVARLVPGLEPGGSAAGGEAGGWQRDRLFSAVAELLAVVASRSPAVLVIDDVHWADDATLDCLTYLLRLRGDGAVTVVATCRSDEAPLDAQVVSWLAHVRGSGAVEEIRLGPLTRAEAGEQVAALAGGPPPGRLADEVYARSEGNPFFTEQLVAAALAGPADGAGLVPAGLPARLAELLLARAGRCGPEGQAVLAALAVAGRPLAEAALVDVTGLDPEAVRRGVLELAAARLLADPAAGDVIRPRHALLAEAVAGALLAAERATLHGRVAAVLESAGDEMLAAEAAGHWSAAGHPGRELPACVAAGRAAERVFGYAQAAVHWQRAIDLCLAAGAAETAGISLPRLYVLAIDALERSGDGVRAEAVAEEALRRFADYPDPATAAVVHHRAARHRAMETPDAGLPVIRESLRLFGQAGPSAEHAEAWFDYGKAFLFLGEGQLAASLAALNRALEIADAAGATVQVSHLLRWLSYLALLRGQVEEGFALLRRGRALAEASGDGGALAWLAVSESDSLLRMGRFQDASDVALRGLATARQTGLQAGHVADLLAANACDALLARGRTADAAALVDPLTTGPPDRDHWLVHQARVELDLLRGDIAGSARRWQQAMACADGPGGVDNAREVAQGAAERALWAGRPGDALAEVQGVLALLTDPDLTILCGRLLAAGMRACADLAEEATARREDAAASAAGAAAAALSGWADRMGGRPFADHPFLGTIPADRAHWEAERTRLAGSSDPAAWEASGKAWQALGCPHRAGYALWRQAEAQLAAGLPASVAAQALRAAVAAAAGHAPLLARIRALAERARITLGEPPAAHLQDAAPAVAGKPDRHGLTDRELSVLKLLALGRTNAQIGAELYMSPKTASVHVSSIFRKLGVAGRVQAATVAERAGLLDA